MSVYEDHTDLDEGSSAETTCTHCKKTTMAPTMRVAGDFVACLLCGFDCHTGQSFDSWIGNETPPEKPISDQVDHPTHYNKHPSGIECIDVVEHMGFNLGNAIKYIWRADLKGMAIQDLEKAKWYIDRELQRRLS